MSTPKEDRKFNLYDYIREKLVAIEILKEKIIFIPKANLDRKKRKLFAKVKKVKVSILMGSIQKMEARTNMQNKLIALYDLNVSWHSAGLE